MKSDTRLNKTRPPEDWETQLALVQTLDDKFQSPTSTPTKTPVKPDFNPTKHQEEEALNKTMHINYRIGIGKVQHLVQKS